MSVRFEFNADVETVFNLVTDPDFLVERSLAIGELEASCDVEDFEDKTEVQMQRVVSRDLPAFLAKLFNPKQTLKFKETWLKDGENWKGDISVEVEGQPVTLNGQFSLKASGAGSVYEVAYTAKANIPLVGGKVEKYIAGQTTDGIQQELDFAKSKLAA